MRVVILKAAFRRRSEAGYDSDVISALAFEWLHGCGSNGLLRVHVY